MLSDVAHLVFPALLILAGIFDFLTLKIPNWLTAGVAILFFPASLIMGLHFTDYPVHLAAGLVMLGIGFGLYAAGVLGAGDAKLMAAAALWFGWPASITFIIYTVLAGGVLSLVFIFWRMLKLDQEIRGHSWVAHFEKLRSNLPYGVAIAAGAVIAYPQLWSTIS